MNYYILIPAYSDDALSITGSEIAYDSMDRYEVTKGKALDDSYLSNFQFKLKQMGCEGDFLANNLGWLIVSDKVKNMAQECGATDLIQMIPFPIERYVKIETSKNYFLLNVLKKIPCMDRKRSEFREKVNDAGERYISAIHRLVLNAASIAKDTSIFRLQECEFYVIVNRLIVEACIKYRVTSCEFSKLKNSNNP